MAHTDTHGFEYDADILDAVQDAEPPIEDLLYLLGGNPWGAPMCQGHDDYTGDTDYCAEGCKNA